MGVAAKSSTRFHTLARVVILAGALGSLTAATSDSASYPTGFQRWEHVHSGVVLPGSPAYPGFGGIHDTYGNAVAMRREAVESVQKGMFRLVGSSFMKLAVFFLEIGSDSRGSRSQVVVSPTEKLAPLCGEHIGWVC